MRKLQRIWLKWLIFVLFGYFLLGKGFAYLFLGEILLASGILIFLLSRRIMLIVSDPLLLLWFAFAFWGFCRTVPYVGQFRFDAIRDDVIWGYGIAALLVAAFVNHSSQISGALNTYRKFLRWYLPIIPILLILSIALSSRLPKIPWSNGVSIIHLKAGDVGVNIAVAGVFLLFFTDKRNSFALARSGVSLYGAAAIAGWWVTVLFILAANRAGTLAIVGALLLVLIMRAHESAEKILIIGFVGALITGSTFLAFPPSLTLAGRTFNSEVLVKTLGSMVGGSGEGTGHETTAQWRLKWWSNIANETFYGPYFWTGRGFGQNLAIVNGPYGAAASREEVTLRSPHSGTMTVLARMGVPGLLLWASINILFAVRMVRAQRLAVKRGSLFWGRLTLWILASWLATLIDLSFDVYLEGPQGGIWFWTIIGFGIAAMRIQKHELKGPQNSLQHPSEQIDAALLARS
jgi:hypothetical protein